MTTATLAREIREDLGTLDDLWRGWKIRHGMLYDPQRSNVNGWTPSQVRSLPHLHELRHALRLELDRVNAQLVDLEQLVGEHGARDAAAKLERRKKRDPRQLTTLSRPAQTTEKPLQRSMWQPPAFALSFSGPWQAGLPMAVKAIPPATQRARK